MNNKKGFTLVETLVAMSLIFIMLVFIITLFTTVRKGFHLSENHVNAAFLGRTLLSDAQKTAFPSIISSFGTKTFTGIDNNAPFSQKINYNLNVQTLDTDKKIVTAIMTWNESTGSKRVILETVIVNPEPNP